MNLADYQSNYSDIITEIKPWKSPDGSPDPNRQSLLKNGMGRLITIGDQMCKTTVNAELQVGLDPDFKMEDRLMNGRTFINMSKKLPKRKKGVPYAVKDIIVGDIIVSDMFQMRVDGIKRDVVVRYANIMKENDPDGWMMFPEILVMKDIGDLQYYLIGGFHRLAAMKENGYETINAICFDGDRRDGIIRAAGENTDRSQRLTHADIKYKCRRLIKSFPDWTFGQLAKWGGVDRNTMERHYKEMEAEGIAPERPERVKYITRHSTEATRKATRTQQTFDDAFPETPSLSLLRKVEALRDETLTFAIEKNGLPPTQFLIDKAQLLSYAEKHHPGIVVNIQSLVRENSTIDRKTVIDQIKIWSVFKAEAETASLIFTVMFDIFEYHIEKRDGKRFPDPGECNWIVDLGLPAAHAEIQQRTLNTYENLKTSRGLGNLPFIDNDRESFYEHAEKQYPQHLVDAHPALNTESDRESNLQNIQTWHALGKDISDDAAWVVAVRDGLVLKRQAKQGLTDAAEKAHDNELDKWNQLNKAVKDHQQEAMERWDLYKTQFGLEFLPFFTADGLYNRFIEPHFSGIKAGFDSLPTSQLETQVKLWEQVSKHIHAAFLSLTNDEIPMPDWFQQMQQELSAPDSEHQNTYQFAQAKCDEAIRIYGQKQASLGLADLDWYHRDGFFDYACAEMEKQGKTLGYPSHTDSIARLSELSEIWESVTNAIKHNAKWVQAIVAKVKRKTEREKETALHNESALCAGHIAAAEHDFNKLRQKYNLQADFQDFYVYACEHFEEQRNLDLSRYVDGLRSIERIQELLAMWKGVVADIGEEADWIKAFVDKRTPQGTVEAGLQIEPLGPSDASPEAESGEPTAIPFEELDTDAKVHIRFAMDRVRVLTKIEGLPDTIITLSEKLYQALTDYASDYSADAEGER